MNDLVFWSSSNSELQNIYKLTEHEVSLHLKALYLLKNNIIASAGAYFESEITRNITNKYKLLFERGEIRFSISDKLYTFREYGERKIEEAGISAYSARKNVISLANEIDNIGHIHKKIGVNLNRLVVDKWCYSLSSTKEGELGYFLLKFLNFDIDLFSRISRRIIQFSLNCDKDFDWEYVKYGFANCDLPNEFQVIAKKRLTQIYTQLSAFTIKSYIDRPELTFKANNNESCFSSGHFLNIIHLMNLTHEFSILTTDELVKLKQSIEFRVFKEFYFSFIESFDYDHILTSQWFPVYKSAALSYTKSSSFDILYFSNKIFSVFQSVGGNSRKYKKPLEILLNAYSSFNFLPIEAFFDIVASKTTDINSENVFKKRISNKIISTNKEHEMISIFISHSSEDRTLAEEIVQLLTGVINIDDSEIRCSSLPGYSFEGVTHVSSTIKKEIQDAGIIVGIITNKSILSSYVLFELGAGWLLEKSIALIDKNIDFDSIPGPLRENHAFRINVKTNLLSLIESVEKETGKKKKKSNIIEMKVNKFIQNIT